MTYIFEKGTSGKHLILLHGTGGDEHSTGYRSLSCTKQYVAFFSRHGPRRWDESFFQA